MKKAIIMTSVAFLLLLAAIAAGLNVVFTVTYIDASFSTFSANGEEDAVNLKKELDGYVGSSTTFLNLDDVKRTVEKYPVFRLESVKKKFPGTVEVAVSERKELFAHMRRGGVFAMISEDGYCLGVSEKNVSRTGGENILLKNFDLSAEVGQRVEGEYFEALLSAFEGFNESLADARANVKSVTLAIVNAGNPEVNRFIIEMAEGVKIEMSDPLNDACEKAKTAMKTYSALGDIQKTTGYITVAAIAGGNINAVYLSE